MSARRSAYRSSRSAASKRSHGRTTVVPGRDWRLRAIVTGLAIVAVVAYATVGGVHHAPVRAGLPLEDAGVIRAQAAEKRLDPALIAGVIYAETKFEPRTSSAGALGLMQILPETANFIARESGGTRFTTGDLATPQINIAYGSWYLRYLLDRYEDNEVDAVAAYNAGWANVDKWVARAHAEGGHLSVRAIPFPETREYVRVVQQAQSRYRAEDARALGIAR